MSDDVLGGFTLNAIYTAGISPTSIALSDIDGVNGLDLTMVNSRSHNVSLLISNGDGTFAPKVDYGAGSSPNSSAIGDIDGDGDLDLVNANFNDDDISVLFNISSL